MPRLLYVKVLAPDLQPGLQRILDGIRAEGAASYKPFTEAGDLAELIAADLATILAERFSAPARDDLPSVIPAPVTAMVGRDADVEAVARMLTAPNRRLIVLTGPGGVGKTRLALAVAERTRRELPDGAALVDLSAVTDPTLVPDAIASALDLVGQGRERPLETLERDLAGRNMLIALDNFEQVLEAAPLVADLLKRAPGLRVLVTSRVALRVRGEQEWRAQPLDIPPPGSSTLAALAENPAVRLFVDRVRAVQPAFRLDGGNAEAVAELCRRMDRLPLALELAAAWMRLLTPRQKLRAVGDAWVWLMVRGHLRQSAPLWPQMAPLLGQEPRGGGRMARAWLLATGGTNQGEFTSAVDLIDDVLPDARPVERPSRIALLLMVRGVARVYSAHEQARADFAEALSIARTADDPVALGYVQSHYGALLCLDGDLDQARALHEEALAIDAIAAGDAEAAAPELAAAVRHYQNLEHFEGLTRCLGALGGLSLERGDPRLAARLLGTASAVRDRFGLRPWPWVIQADRQTADAR